MQQSAPNANTGLPEDEVFSLKNEGARLMRSVRYALAKWKLLALAGIAGAGLGLVYKFVKPLAYSSRITFVVEDSKASGTGLMSALAGQFGFDIGGLTGGSGVLSGDNILQLLKSNSMVRKTLLTPIDSGSRRSLADLYAEVYGWKEKWQNNKKVNKLVSFPAGASTLPRLEDSLLQRIEQRIIDKELSVTKTDRKLSFIELSTTTRHEGLSIAFSTRLLKVATDFYIDTKTRRLTRNIQRLQAKADSLERILNRKTYSAADANRLLLDANPAYSAPEVSAEISARDKYVQSTIYAEIIKNLEMSKTAQIQETPTVQIVDTPELPLPTNKVKAIPIMVFGGLLGIVICGIALIALRRPSRDAYRAA